MWLQKEVEHGGVGGKAAQEFPDKDFLADKNTSNDTFANRLNLGCIDVIGLADIAVPLFDGDAVIVFGAEGIIAAMAGKVDEEYDLCKGGFCFMEAKYAGR